MSPVRTAATPRGVLYRIGHLPDPWDWPPREATGDARFDDQAGEFRTLYTGPRLACFLETLARFRPLPDAIAHLREMARSLEPSSPRLFVPMDWFQRRALAQLRLVPGQRWLDLRAIESRETLRIELAETLAQLGLRDLDVSSVTGPRRELTKIIARWAYEKGFAGIAYHSRLDPSLTLWAVFEGAAFERIGEPEPIVPEDPDLMAAADLFRLVIPSQG